ncbi:MAG TPA: hypothetical protein VM866_04725 [Pyrinomonadaceae bacterium]|jgi:hypothetical protein|nr:hypothetical protein [Pyrinomonadaceae bacterium]
MIEQHLRRQALVAPPISVGNHLNEDALAAFVEGRLTQNESAPLVSHLVACAFCRRATAELVRLDAALGKIEGVQIPQSEEPGRVRRLLSDLAARVLPSSDGEVVFAYHAPAEDFEQAEKAEDRNSLKDDPDDRKRSKESGK